MLVCIGSISVYRVEINPNAPIWYYGKPCPISGAKIASILHRMESEDIIYVGF